VATDNHVGAEERDPIRKDDAWKTFDEIMQLAKSQDVDMVLLGGDLFHDNKPSRKAIYQVMRSLRKNCLGDKPCELEFLSDFNEVFESAFPTVNYEDLDINVSIPVFSIHGNHDDPTGDGHYCSLDLLQVAGLVNYFGKVPEADKIEVRPVLLQKGMTKLALYGLSNVRDERMHRNFRDNKIKWFRPDTQAKDFFKILTLHQNHHAHTPTSYIAENSLPDFLDLVVWGHEHECLIDPKKNPETGFHVMQPGSSVATSLVPGEAVPKHIAVVSVTGKSFQVEKIRLKSVRPFITKEIVLATDKRFKGLDKKKENRQAVKEKLMGIVNEMIEQANSEWLALQDEEMDEEHVQPPLPLIRLKVEYTAHEGGKFEVENPQRFSQKFAGRVANANDVVQFHRRKTVSRSGKVDGVDAVDLEHVAAEEISMESIVKEILSNQSLKVLPQRPFGDAVAQFVDKDDRTALETFVAESRDGQVKDLLDLDVEDDALEAAMEETRKKRDEQFAAGQLKSTRMRVEKPRPEDWDSDMEGPWVEQEGVVSYVPRPETQAGNATRTASNRGQSHANRIANGNGNSNGDVDSDNMFLSDNEPLPRTNGRAATKPTRGAAAKKTAPARTPAARGRKNANADPFVHSEEEDEPELEEQEDDDFMSLDDEPPPPPPPPAAKKRAPPARKPAPSKAGAKSSAAKKGKQTTLDFSQSQRPAGGGRGRGAGAGLNNGATQQTALELSDDEIEDGDGFESMPISTRTRRH
jgi:double-strand break repair protein MRE11